MVVYLSQFEGTGHNCGTYGHKSEYFTKGNKTSIVSTAITTYKQLKNVSTGIIMSYNVGNITIRVKKKMSGGRKKNGTKKEKNKGQMSFKRYSMTSYVSNMAHLHAKIKI